MIEPYAPTTSPAAIEDLRTRLRATRWPASPEEAGTDAETGAHLYRTSVYFLERIGITSLDELPELAPFVPDMDEFDLDDEMVAAPASAESSDGDDGPGEPDDAGE